MKYLVSHPSNQCWRLVTTSAPCASLLLLPNWIRNGDNWLFVCLFLAQFNLIYPNIHSRCCIYRLVLGKIVLYSVALDSPEQTPAPPPPSNFEQTKNSPGDFLLWERFDDPLEKQGKFRGTFHCGQNSINSLVCCTYCLVYSHPIIVTSDRPTERHF